MQGVDYHAEEVRYRGYLDSEASETIEEFARKRTQMSAALLADIMDPATDCSWSISYDSGQTYQNPDLYGKKALSDAVWAIRAEVLDCDLDCNPRMKLDGFWRCNRCNAIWTDPDYGRPYGIYYTDRQLIQRMKQMIRERAAADGMASFEPVRRQYIEKFLSGIRRLRNIRGRSPDPVHGWQTAVVDVKFGIWGYLEFLVLTSDDYGQIWNQWQ